MNNFSKRLISFREKKGLKPSQAAESIGVPLSTYRDWENGVNILGADSFLKISRAFEIPISTLMSGKNVNNNLVDDIIYIEKKIQELKKNVTTLL